MACNDNSPPPKRLRQLTLEGLFKRSTVREERPNIMSTASASEGSQSSPCSSSAMSHPKMFLHVRQSAAAELQQGAPLKDISFGPSCLPVLRPLASGPLHTVTFRPDRRGDQAPPLPFPDHLRDVWDSNHVRSPCSAQNLYPITTDTGGKKLLSRWALIRKSLLKPIANSYDLEEAIMEYNSRQASKWSFGAVHAYFSTIASEEEATAFFSSLLPKIVRLALRLPELVTHALPLLKVQETYSLTLSQEQAACLLANAFLCTFPRRNAMHKLAEFASYPSINFNSLFAGKSSSISSVCAAKLKCIFHYFTRITSSTPTGSITFTRQVCTNLPHWDKCTAPLSKLHVTSEGTIEDNGQGMLQVDFANRYVGGGVLGAGCVQEEIRFLLCPELILSRLFTEQLQDNECLIVVGAERFSSYSGYGSTFEWAGTYKDEVQRDTWGRKETHLVAMDALVISQSLSQFKPGLMRRELNKAYCGFMNSDATTTCGKPMAVATGTWGCGAFGGDKQLKALLQWLAASAAGRDMVYFTFQDAQLQKELHIFYSLLTAHQVTVKDVWKALLLYHHEASTSATTLYDFILNKLGYSVSHD